MIKDKVLKLIDSGEGIKVNLNGTYIPRSRVKYLSEIIEADFYRIFPWSKILEVIKENNFQRKAVVDALSELYWSDEDTRNRYKIQSKLTTQLNKYFNESITFDSSSDLTILFTKEFDWTPGEYGDHNSCWWASKAGAKDMLKKEGGFAIKVHQGRNKIARCWGFFLEENYSEPGLLIFNSYSNLGIGYINDWVAYLVKSALEYKDYYPVRLTNNNGGGQNILFINQNQGFLLSDKVHKKEINIDLRWKEVKQVQCALCRGHFLEEKTTLVEERTVCEECLRTKVSPCFNCTNLFFSQNTQIFERDGFQQTYCFSCFGNMFAICRHDSKIHLKSEMVIIDYGDYCANVNIKHLILNKCSQCDSLNHKRRNWCWNCGKPININPVFPNKPEKEKGKYNIDYKSLELELKNSLAGKMGTYFVENDEYELEDF